ncbi:hypothetical protein SAMN04488042_10478 [Shimia aestuarii]|uniref:Uncharacterized protein n=1 Tax=Shimia aestuarii TaxID=254406 RepID=A0A1I4NB78_9RHOB|nr:hypothetical protein SAMN04488042_10478 [Shimia aestuarii]
MFVDIKVSSERMNGRHPATASYQRDRIKSGKRHCSPIAHIQFNRLHSRAQRTFCETKPYEKGAPKGALCC